MPMSQKDRLSVIGSKNTIFGFLIPFLLNNSQLLRDKLPLASVFGIFNSTLFHRGLVFKYVFPATDCQ